MKRPGLLPWTDDPSKGTYIDDNALYTLELIRSNIFAGSTSDWWYRMSVRRPADWLHREFLECIVRVCEKYNLEPQEIVTHTEHFDDKYEVKPEDTDDPAFLMAWDEYSKSLTAYNKCQEEHGDGYIFFKCDKCNLPFPRYPKKHKGAYGWALDVTSGKLKSKHGDLLQKTFSNNLTLKDLRLLLQLGQSAGQWFYGTGSESALAPEIAAELLDATYLRLEITEDQRAKIEADLEPYYAAYSSDRLKKGNSIRRAWNVNVALPANVLTFKKHCEVFTHFLVEQREKFGDVFSFDNPFDPPIEIEGDTDAIKKRYANRNVLFMHVLFSFQRMGLIRIHALGHNYDFYNDRPLNMHCRLEVIGTLLTDTSIAPMTGKAVFDIDTRKLSVAKQSLVLKDGSNQFYAIKTLFENPSKKWYLSDIAESVDGTHTTRKNYYQALYQIVGKLSKCGITDFFNLNTTTVEINPKYLA